MNAQLRRTLSRTRPNRLGTWGAADVLFWALAAGCVLVPCAFTTRLQAAFVVPKLAVLWASLALSLAVIAYGALRSETFPWVARPVRAVDAAVMSFVSLTVLAWAASTDREQSLYGERLQHQGVLTVLLYVGFFYVARLAVTDDARLRRLLGAITLGAALVAGYALVQRVGLDPIWDGFLPGGRVFSSIGQANALAACFVLVLPLAASLTLDSRRHVRVVGALATVAIALALAFAQSRGGYLGLVAVAVVLAIGWRHELRVRTKHLVVATALGVVMVLLAISTGALGRVVSHADSSAQFHRDAWRVALEVVKEHPVLGTGPETFPDVFPSYSHRVLPDDRADALDAFRVESPHNVYLAIASGSGIAALLAYLLAIGGFVVVVVRALGVVARELRIALVAVLAAVTGHLVTDAFMSAEVTGTWLFWVLIGAALGVVAAVDRGPA